MSISGQGSMDSRVGKPVNVFRYVGKNKRILYKFVGRNAVDTPASSVSSASSPLSASSSSSSSSPIETIQTHTIKETLFQDDYIVTVCEKLAFHIREAHKLSHPDSAPVGDSTLPYAWKHDTPLRCVVSTSWTSFRTNPFSPNINGFAKVPVPSVKYTNRELLNTASINIVFRSDLPSTIAENVNAVAHYFKDGAKITSKSILAMKKADDTLHKLITIPSADLPTIGDIIYNKLSFKGSVGGSSSTKQKAADSGSFDLIQVFDNMRTSKEIPLIQCVANSSHVVYKLFEGHGLSREKIAALTSSDKIPTSSGVVGYVKTKSVMGRFFMDTRGMVTVYYDLNSAALVTAQNGVDTIMRFINSVLPDSLSMSIDNMSLSTDIHLTDVDIGGIAEVVRKEMFPVLNVSPLQKVSNGIEFQYKRVPTYEKKDDVIEYITSCFSSGLDEKSVVEMLQDMFGVNAKEAMEYIDEANAAASVTDINGTDAKKKKRLVLESHGIILRLTRKTENMVGVKMEFSPSLQDAFRALGWLRAIAASWQKVKKAKPVAKKGKKIVLVESPPASPPAPAPPPVAPPADDEDDEGFGGGAKPKLAALIAKDPQIFNATGYATQCQTNFQPIALTKADKERIDDKYPGSYDNFIKYGSDSNNPHYYVCPRIWCPEDKVSMTMQQLEANNGVCPSGSKPNKEYDTKPWGNDPAKAHYAYLQAKCAPCCGKKVPSNAKISECMKQVGFVESTKNSPQKKSDKETDGTEATSPKATPPPVAAPPVVAKEKKADGYLVTAIDPVDEKRWGSLPKNLFTIIEKPSVQPESCKSLNSTACSVRAGIKQGTDSFMAALTHIMSMPSKDALVDHLQKQTSLETFIQLEDGNLLKAFVNADNGFERVNGHSTGMDAKVEQLVTHFPAYATLFDISEESSFVKKARHAAIFDAYNGYFAYLRSDELKDPDMVFGILKKMGIALFVWERDTVDDVFLKCPSFTSFGDIFTPAPTKSAYRVAMMLKHKQWYEPIEKKAISSEGRRLIAADEYRHMTHIVSQCTAVTFATAQRVDTVVNGIRNMSALLSQVTFAGGDPGPFKPKCLILAPDASIYAILTVCGLWVSFEPIPISQLDVLTKLFSTELKVKVLLRFHEDIAGQSITTAPVFKKDLKTFVDRLEAIGFGVKFSNAGDGDGVGTIHDDGVLVKSKYTLPPVIYSDPPIVRVNDIEVLKVHTVAKLDETDYWNTLKLKVGRYVLNRLTSASELSRDRVITHFKRVASPKEFASLSVVVKELFDGIRPMTKARVLSWISSVGQKERLPWYSPRPVRLRANHEWAFSQSAVEVGLPDAMVIGDGVRPQLRRGDVYEALNVYTPPPVGEVQIEKFIMTDQASTTQTKLPSKWKKSWLDYVQLKPKTNIDVTVSLPAIFEHLKKQLNLNNLEYEDVAKHRNKHICSLFEEIATNDKNFMNPSKAKDKLEYQALVRIFDDAALRLAWNKKEFKNGTKFVDGFLLKKEKHKVVALCREKETEAIPPCETDLVYISDLLSISILLIYRAPTLKGDEKVEKLRASDQEKLVSTTYIKCDKSPWILIMEKKTDVEHGHVYGIVVKTTDPLRVLHDTEQMGPDIKKLLAFLDSHNSQSKQ